MERNWFTVVFLGDSLTTGFQQGPGYLPQRYYPFTNLLEAGLRIFLRERKAGFDVVIVNQGRDGDSTGGMLERLPRAVADENPQLVFLWGGLNDLSGGLPPEAVAANVGRLVDLVREMGSRPVVVGLPPVAWEALDAAVREANERLREVAASKDAPYLDVYQALQKTGGGVDPRYSNDGVHLSDSGYRVLQQLFHGFLVGVLEERLDSDHL